jgi:hypothetical protein
MGRGFNRVRGGSAPQKHGDGRNWRVGLERAAELEGPFCGPVAPRPRWPAALKHDRLPRRLGGDPCVRRMPS